MAPRLARPVDQLIQARRAAHKRQAALRSESRKLVVEELEARRNAERVAESKMGPFLSALSAVPESRRKDAGTSFVPRGGSVAAANAASIVSGIEGRVNQAAVVGGVSLSAEQAAKFRAADGTFVRDIPAAALDPYLWPRRPGSGAGLVRAVPPALRCSHAPLDPCVAVLEGKSPGVEVEPPDDGPVVQTTPLKADVPVLIENLVQYTTPPESATIFDGHTRAGLDDVQKGVNGFTLHSGPADAPALHDFHHLQIAFAHVWQELFDDALIQTGKELYTDLVELGVDPNEYLMDPLEAKIKSLAQKSLKNAAAGSTATASFDPPAAVVRAFDITQQQWRILLDKQVESTSVLSTSQTKDEFFGSPKDDSETTTVTDSTTLAEVLEDLATEIVRPIGEDFFKSENTGWLAAKREDIRSRRRQGERIIAYASQELAPPADIFDQFHPNLAALAQAMKEPYRFSIYAANNVERSVNFGIITTYRQRWEPVSYQVGELVKTVPLCPKEVRKFSRKVAIRKSRAEKEVENSLQSRRTETSETARAETTIVQKAQNKTNFRMSAEGGVNVGIAEAKGSTAFEQDAATESEEVKKEFREAVFKAAQEYKSERTTEVTVSASEEISTEESGEISNPNDEITVTYLFYELERRYRVSEQIHRITPIVLVAQEFPAPNEIDEDWIVAHDWILRRVLLDDSFAPALNYLASAVVGDEYALREMYKNLEQQRRLAEELQDELVAIRGTSEGRYAALQKSIAERADAVQAEDDAGGIMPMPVGFINDTADVSVDAALVREEAAKHAYERAMKQEKEVLGRLERETTALNALTETYTKNLSDHLNRKNQIARLRVHLKSNIMYYMQAIWSHEPTDQRFFRLHEVRVPRLEGKATYNLEADGDATPAPSAAQVFLKVVAKCELDPDLEFQPLNEVADLDNLLGFKGNYMMFPLKKSNALTDFMMVPYLDAAMGVKDPDPLGNWILSDFVKYVCCLSKKLPAAEFDRLLPGLRATYYRLLNAPKPDGEEIVVPTESLYIEALPGAHPVLEDFKLAHRLLDVKKVQAEVRTAELENVRFVARLLAGEREDPTIEKKVVVEGGSTITTEPV